MALDFKDYTTNGNDLTNNGVSENAHSPNSALTISGEWKQSEADYLIAPDSASLDLNGNFTFEVSLNMSSMPDDYPYIFSKGGWGEATESYGFVMYQLTPTTFIYQTQVNQGGNSGSCSAVLSTGVDYTLGCVWNGETYKWYVNGEWINDSVYGSGSPTPNNEPLVIGARILRSDGTDYYQYTPNAVMNNIRIWNVARTDQEIADNWNVRLAGNETGLVAYYPLEETDAHERYWVGDTGNWSDDENHWAKTSGGTPAIGNLPTALDDVFIDAESGFGGGGTIETVVYTWDTFVEEDGVHAKSYTYPHTLLPNTNYKIKVYFYGNEDSELGITVWNPELNDFGPYIAWNPAQETSPLIWNILTPSDMTNFAIYTYGWCNLNNCPNTGIEWYDVLASEPAPAGGTITLNEINGNCHDFTSNSGHTYTLKDTDQNHNNGLICSGSLILESGLTYDSASIQLVSVDTGETLTFDNATLLDGIILMGEGGAWTLQDDLVISGVAGGFDQQSGTFDANDNNITARLFLFRASTPSAPTVIMGSGTWEATRSGSVWRITEDDGVVTIVPETSTIKYTNIDVDDKNFIGGNKIYNNIWFSGSGNGNRVVMDSNTFNDLKIDAGNTAKFSPDSTQTVTTFTAIGTDGNLIVLDSLDPITGQFNLYSDSLIVCDYLDIKNSNAGSIWYAGSHSVDSGNNTGWIFSGPPRDLYWVGGSGNWDEVAHWSLSSGGLGGEAMPTQSDNVFIDENSGLIENDIIQLTDNPQVHDIHSWVEFSYALTGAGRMDIWGSIDFDSALDLSGVLDVQIISSDSTFQSAGTLFPQIEVRGGTGTLTLLDNLNVLYIWIGDGRFNANSFDITAITYSFGWGDTPEAIIQMGSGTWQVDEDGGNDGWFVDTRGGTTTFESESSTIKTMGFTRFNGGDGAYNNLWITAGLDELNGDNSFTDIKIDAGCEVIFLAETTQTVETFTAIGEDGSPINLNNGDENMGQFNLHGVGDDIHCNWLVISKSNAGSIWYAGSHSVDSGNNTGWLFQDPPPPIIIPDTPISASPENDETDVSLNPVLTGSVYASTPPSTHKFTDWRIAIDEDFITEIWNSEDDQVNLTTITVDGTHGGFMNDGDYDYEAEKHLKPLTEYWFKFRYKDDWSEYSPPIHFTTTEELPPIDTCAHTYPSPFLMVGVMDTFGIYHFIRDSEKENYDTEPYATCLKCQITPASPDLMALHPDISVGQLFEIYSFASDVIILNGDKFISETDSKEYVVRGEPAVYNAPQFNMYYQRITAVALKPL